MLDAPCNAEQDDLRLREGEDPQLAGKPMNADKWPRVRLVRAHRAAIPASGKVRNAGIQPTSFLSI